MPSVRFSLTPMQYRLSVTAMAIMLVLSFEPAIAWELDTENDGTGQALDDGRRTLKQFPVNMVRGAVGLFERESLQPALVGSIVTGLSTLLDDEVRGEIAAEDDDLADLADDNLGPTGLGYVALALFIGGQFSEDARFRAMTYDLGVAAANTFGFTQVLKASVGRERPNGRNDYSFPSGHTSNAFALASVADAHYGKKVGLPAYAAASLIGVSRLRKDAHWLSDIVAGAALGYLTGRTVVRQNNEPRQHGAKPRKIVRITPTLGPSFGAIFVEMTF